MSRKSFVQRALGGHAAIGLLVSALIYLISLSGTLVVIHDRWQRWEQPEIPEMSVLTPRSAQAAMIAAAAMGKGKPPSTHLYVRMPGADLPRAVVTTDHGAWYVDGTGRIVEREATAWTDFVTGLHEYLHLPQTWGIVAVGAMGVMLAALVVTGVLAHPRIVRDAFRLRTRHDPQIARADWHNRLGVWTLPFVLAVALTGAFIGLGNVGFSVLANAYSGGDILKAYAPVFGAEPAPDATAAPLPDIATALRAVAARVPEATPTYVIVHDPGTVGQFVQVLAEHPRRLIYGESYAFDARGQWRGAVGLSDGALGKQAAASTYNLHFGNFGGLAVELAYLLFGFALCVVTATGTTLWLQKRARRGLPSLRLSACWTVVVWGTPLAILVSLWLRASIGPDAPLVAAFWMMLAAALALAVAIPSRVSARHLQAAVYLAVIATALAHLLRFWSAAFPVLAIDGAALVLALLALMTSRRLLPGERQVSRQFPNRAPDRGDRGR